MKNTEYYNQQIGALLKELRLKRDLTQTDLANRAGISRVRYQKYEDGTNTITMEMFMTLCRALDADPYEALKKIDWSRL